MKNKKDFIVNFNLSEGNRYKINNVKVESSIRKVKPKLSSLLEIKPGDWYNTDKIDRTIQNINEKTSEIGYAFVEVIPKIRKLKQIKLI